MDSFICLKLSGPWSSCEAGNAVSDDRICDSRGTEGILAYKWWLWEGIVLALAAPLSRTAAREVRGTR